MLEDDVLPARIVAAVDDRDDVRMREARDRSRLGAEALEVLRIAGVPLVENLDRDAPAAREWRSTRRQVLLGWATPEERLSEAARLA